MWSSLPCFSIFAVLLSLHLVTFLMFFLLLVYAIILAVGACLSCSLPSHSWRSLSSQGSIYRPLTQILATRVPCETSKLWKSNGVVHCSVKNDAVSCVNHCERITQYWAILPEERRKKEAERKIFVAFCEFLVWYLHNAFSCHWEPCWSLKHLKMNGTLL